MVCAGTRELTGKAATERVHVDTGERNAGFIRQKAALGSLLPDESGVPAGLRSESCRMKSGVPVPGHKRLAYCLRI